jgi:hypothetical protein
MNQDFLVLICSRLRWIIYPGMRKSKQYANTTAEHLLHAALPMYVYDGKWVKSVILLD